jgi:hypothetical protein
MKMRSWFHTIGLALTLLVLATPLWGATCTWSGPVYGVWSDPANWGGTAPVAGDDLIFPTETSTPPGSFTTTNDLAAGTSFHSIAFSDSRPDGYYLQGNAITVTDGGVTNTGGHATFALDVTVGADQTWTVAGLGTTLTFISVELGGHTLTLISDRDPWSSSSYPKFDFFWIHGTGAVMVSGGPMNLGAGYNDTFPGSLTNNGASVDIFTTTLTEPYLQTAGFLYANVAFAEVTIDGGTFRPSASTAANLTLARGATYQETVSGYFYGGPSLIGPDYFTSSAATTQVTGTVDLGGATLDLIASDIPPGSPYTFIDNQGGSPVVNTFAGLPEGSSVVASNGQLFTITYAGGKGNDVVITAQRLPTSVTLTSSVNPSSLGEVATFTAHVASSYTFGDPRTGTVTFYDGGTPLGSAPLQSYVGATFATSGLSGGSHNITAQYGGETDYAPSTSGILTQVVNVPLTPPVVTFTATPSTIAPGGSSTLTWTTTGATSVLITGLRFQALSGSVVVDPSETTTYTLTATGDGGTTVLPVTVTVTSGPSITFTASPGTIVAGQTSTLQWSTANATSVTIDHGVGLQPASGSLQVSPPATTVYTLTATGPDGVSTAPATVTVLLPPDVRFDAAPQSISVGGQTTLTWSTTNATSVFIDHDIGFVEAGGTRLVSPTTTTTYVITASGLAGTTSASTTVSVMSRRRVVRP